MNNFYSTLMRYLHAKQFGFPSCESREDVLKLTFLTVLPILLTEFHIVSFLWNLKLWFIMILQETLADLMQLSHILTIRRILPFDQNKKKINRNSNE